MRCPFGLSPEFFVTLLGGRDAGSARQRSAPLVGAYRREKPASRGVCFASSVAGGFSLPEAVALRRAGLRCSAQVPGVSPRFKPAGFSDAIVCTASRYTTSPSPRLNSGRALRRSDAGMIRAVTGGVWDRFIQAGISPRYPARIQASTSMCLSAVPAPSSMTVSGSSHRATCSTDFLIPMSPFQLQ